MRVDFPRPDSPLNEKENVVTLLSGRRLRSIQAGPGTGQCPPHTSHPTQQGLVLNPDGGAPESVHLKTRNITSPLHKCVQWTLKGVFIFP